MSNNNKPRQPVKPQRKLDGSLVGASLNVSNPAATDMDLSYQPVVMSNMFMNLPVNEIDFFDKNPRRQHDDELYQQIKDSIRATGVQQPVHVTRRPGGSHYILAQGGNTRLKIVKELWQQTGDSRFSTIPCIYIEYTSEVYRDMTLRDHVFNAGLGGLDYLDQMTMNLFTMVTEYPEINKAITRFNDAAAAAKQSGLLPDWDLYEEE